MITSDKSHLDHFSAVAKCKKTIRVFFYRESLRSIPVLIQSLKRMSSLPSLKNSKIHCFANESQLYQNLENIVVQKSSQILLLETKEEEEKIKSIFESLQNHKVFRDFSHEILEGITDENIKGEAYYPLGSYTHTIQIFPFQFLMKNIESLDEYWWMTVEIPMRSLFYSLSF